MAAYPPDTAVIATGSPVVPPLAVLGLQYCFPYQTFLVMREKGGWRDDMEVMDTNGVLHFYIREKQVKIFFFECRHDDK